MATNELLTGYLLLCAQQQHYSLHTLYTVITVVKTGICDSPHTPGFHYNDGYAYCFHCYQCFALIVLSLKSYGHNLRWKYSITFFSKYMCISIQYFKTFVLHYNCIWCFLCKYLSNYLQYPHCYHVFHIYTVLYPVAYLYYSTPQ